VPAERVGQREVGANSMAVSGLSFKKTLVGTGQAISLLLSKNRLRKRSSGHVGPHFRQ